MERFNAVAALCVMADNSANKDAIREAGGVPKLVALLDVATTRIDAAGALCGLANGNRADQDAIREAGGVPKLVSLLDAPEARGERRGGAVASGPLLQRQQRRDPRGRRRAEAGGAPRRAGGRGGSAAGILWKLAEYYNSANQDAIRDAGGVPKLVALLDVPQARKDAARALWALADCNSVNQDAIVEQLCTAGTANVPSKFAAAVEARREEIRRAALKREYEARGADFTPPDDFVCPMTYKVMRDPVLASDGHGYERKAIERALKAKRVSPLTGKKVRGEVFPNFQLKKRIREWGRHRDRGVRQGGQGGEGVRGVCVLTKKEGEPVSPAFPH